jgi:hypothetical protein
MSLSTPSGLRAASPRNSKDYSDSTRTPLGLQWTRLGLGLEICRPLAGGLVQSESEWSPSVRSESDWSPLGKVGEYKDLPWSCNTCRLFKFFMSQICMASSLPGVHQSVNTMNISRQNLTYTSKELAITCKGKAVYRTCLTWQPGNKTITLEGN